MKHSILVITCALFAFDNMAMAQEQNVVSSSGTHTANASGSVSWTIGEPVIETVVSGSNHATQGFHQSNIWVVGIEELAEIEISVYPNPTSDFVNIVTPNPVKLSIYDMAGRLVALHDLRNETNAVDVSQFSRGTYQLVFEATGLESRSAQLVVQ